MRNPILLICKIHSFMEQNLEVRVSALEKQLYILKKIFSFEEASRFLNLSRSYLYQLTSKGLIPHYKPQGKMIYFERELLEDWLRQNPVRTKQELQNEAANMVIFPKKKK
jgi:excisionase family DNA binding protein